MTDPVKIKLLAHLNWNERLHDAIKAKIEHATDAGELTNERLPNTGTEMVAWIGFDADPAAFALFYEARPRVLWIDQIFVEAYWRRQGFASLLLAAIKEHAKAIGYEAIEYGAMMANRASRLMGEKRGYEEKHVTLRLDLPVDRDVFIPRSTPGEVGDDIPF